MKEKQKLVSIILNCFNGEKYLKDALESVLNQTYNNWELVFWDNKSKDGSKKILDLYKSEKLKYYRSNVHTSLYEARNLAIKECKGEFIAFIDADDYWEKDKLEKQIKLFENKNVGVVYGNLWIYNEKLKKKKIFSNKKLLKGIIFEKILSDYNIGVITSVIRKEILYQNNISFESSYNHIGDFDLFIKLSKICEFDAIQEPVATYRVHGENLSLKNAEKEIVEMKKWFQSNSNFLNKFQEKEFMIRLQSKEFVNIKLNKNFFYTLNFFLKSTYLMKNLRNYLLLIVPSFILKKIMWYQ
jgi:glycosyltransferase involved in cell wall biosynthesis